MNGQASSAEVNALRDTGRLRIEREGLIIDGQIDPERHQLYLVTTVFAGGNYIPKSVRRCLQNSGLHAAGSHRDVSLIIDEARFRVMLLIQSSMPEDELFDLYLDDFMGLAHEWQAILDDHGKQDLVYTRISQ